MSRGRQSSLSAAPVATASVALTRGAVNADLCGGCGLVQTAAVGWFRWWVGRRLSAGLDAGLRQFRRRCGGGEIEPRGRRLRLRAGGGRGSLDVRITPWEVISRHQAIQLQPAHGAVR